MDDGLVDYYALLGLSRDAGTTEIDQRIRQELRIWTRRTNHADLARRQEAERRVRDLSASRGVLLDTHRRADYDRCLADQDQRRDQRRDPPAARPEPAADRGGWLEQARRYLAAGDYDSARYAAREARDADPGSGEAWNALARANTELDSHSEALFEARRAVELVPGSVDYRMDLATVHEALGQWDQALSCYEAVERLDPGREDVVLARAEALQRAGDHDGALRILEDRLPRAQDPALVGGQLALALIDAAERAPDVQPGDSTYVVTSREEVEAMERYLARAREVTADPEIMDMISRLDRYLDWCRRRHFQSPAWMFNGCFFTVAGVVLVFAAAFVLLGSGFVETFGRMLSVAVLLGPPALVLYFAASAPGWRINRLANRSDQRWRQ